MHCDTLVIKHIRLSTFESIGQLITRQISTRLCTHANKDEIHAAYISYINPQQSWINVFFFQIPRRISTQTLLYHSARETQKEEACSFLSPSILSSAKSLKAIETEKGLSRRGWKEARERIVECVVTRAFRANKKAIRSYHLACFPTRAQTRLLTREIWKRGGRGDYECDPRAPPHFSLRFTDNPFLSFPSSRDFLISREIRSRASSRFVGLISLGW